MADHMAENKVEELLIALEHWRMRKKADAIGKLVVEDLLQKIHLWNHCTKAGG